MGLNTQREWHGFVRQATMVGALWALLPCAAGLAQPVAQEAQKAALEFLDVFKGHDVAKASAVELFDKKLGALWRKQTERSKFSDEMERIAKSLGGAPSDRKLVSSTPFKRVPLTNQEGDFLQLVFSTRYPAAQVREEVYLERSGALGSEWTVIGALIRPQLSN